MLLLLLLLLAGTMDSRVHGGERPNIVFILADDLSWADPGCYGHPWHQTPNLDRLAKDGMRFTNAYSAAPICSASRASILTGKTPARLHFEFVTKNEPGTQKLDAPVPMLAPPFTLNLSLEERTIAEVLNEEGYRTAFFGKWHLNTHYRRYLGWSPTHGPARQGFQIAEEDFGSHPYAWGKTPPQSIEVSGSFAEDSMIDRTIQFISRDHKQPFFVMASQFYVHTPVRTQCKWLLEKYEALVPADSPNRRNRVAYAAFVEELDDRVGRILTALDTANLRERTLVVFTSDNGGHPEYTANGPLRGSKWNLYEGGIRVPMIVRWPGHVMPGAVCELPVSGTDLQATFAEVGGREISDAVIRHTDGSSIVGALSGGDEWLDRDLIWHFPYYHPEAGYAVAPDRIGIDDFVTSRTHPHSAIRRGNWKLIYFHENDRVELYDLKSDISEQNDLSDENELLADQLRRRLLLGLKNMDARFPSRIVR
ncbi:MAG: sulfatase [Planctomycetaceae bacterium]